MQCLGMTTSSPDPTTHSQEDLQLSIFDSLPSPFALAAQHLETHHPSVPAHCFDLLPTPTHLAPVLAPHVSLVQSEALALPSPKRRHARVLMLLFSSQGNWAGRLLVLGCVRGGGKGEELIGMRPVHEQRL